jgi:hypothetical protein
MKRAIHLEHRASSSRSKHEGESSLGLCDRLDRTRDNSQRQLPTDHDYAVPTREYQIDQSSLKPAQAAARSVLGEKQKQRQLQKQPHRSRGVDTVTPYQAKTLIDTIVGGWSPNQKLRPHQPKHYPVLLGADSRLHRQSTHQYTHVTIPSLAPVGLATAASFMQSEIYSIFGIGVDRKHTLKWLFPQEKATFHGAEKVYMYSENALAPLSIPQICQAPSRPPGMHLYLVSATSTSTTFAVHFLQSVIME